MERFGKKYSIPVAYCDDFGHGSNHAIFPIGRGAVLDTENKTLLFKQSIIEFLEKLRKHFNQFFWGGVIIYATGTLLSMKRLEGRFEKLDLQGICRMSREMQRTDENRICKAEYLD